MTTALLGRKVGMTRVFDPEGRSVPVTVIEAGPCFVSQIRTAKTAGYNAVQLAFEDIKPRRSTMPLIGHDARAGVSPKRYHREFRVADDLIGGYELGQEVTVASFEQVKFVDVSGVTKGRGFSGGVRRWGFKGQPATHGVERKHRSPGSVGGRSSNAGTGPPKKGAHKAGQYGHVRVTVRSLEVVACDKDKNLLLVKGPVPGANRGLLEIRQAKRLYKRKASKAEAS